MRRSIVPVILFLALAASHAHAYIEAIYPLGRIITESTNIVVVRVEQVDQEKGTIIYKRIADLKGTNPADTIKHTIAHNGFNPREWQFVMQWAQVGQIAVIFHNGQACEVCIDKYWYQAYVGEWWAMSHGEPYLLRSFCGRPEKLIPAVQAILKGQETVVSAMSDGDRMALQLRAAKLLRVKASLKIQDYDLKRDFEGWGSDEFQGIQQMPGFEMYSGIPRVDPGARGIAVADVDGDGKPDICLFGDTHITLQKNAGSAFTDIPLPVSGGAVAGGFADYNGDHLPDLLLATAQGPRLLTNQGGTFKDDTALLPHQSYYNLTACAWIDYDGDGKPDILLADAYLGLRLYHNLTTDPAKPVFEDVSDKMGLGMAGIGANEKGDHLIVADVNGDGRPDFLFTAGQGILAINTPNGFVLSKDSGLSLATGQITPVFGDFLGDKHQHLFVPQHNSCKIFRNDGAGHFTDITAACGLNIPLGDGVCAAAADFGHTGRTDIFVGCLRGPNRYLRNTGNGKFIDAGEEIGLYQHIYNTRAIATVDFTTKGRVDLIFNNEGLEPCILLANPSYVSK